MSEKECRVISLMGQKQTCAQPNAMSALPSKTDIRPDKIAIPYPLTYLFVRRRSYK